MSHLLLVHPAPSQLRGIVACLEERGCQVAKCVDSVEALRICERGGVRMVLTSLSIDNDDGPGLCAAVKQLPSPPPVALFADLLDADTVLRCLAAGADDVLLLDDRLDEFARKCVSLIKRGPAPTRSAPMPVAYLGKTYMIAATGELILRIMLSMSDHFGRTQAKYLEESGASQKIREQLFESEHRTRAIVETAIDCIIVVNQDGTIAEFNSAAETRFGVSKRKAIGADFVELFIAPDSRQRYRDNLARFASQGVMGSLVGRRVELELLRKDGESFFAEMATQAVMIKGEAAFAIFLHDISERRQAEEERQRHAIELQRSNRDLEDFAHAASHDLQEPLRTVTSYCQLVRRRSEGKLDENCIEFLDSALDAANRMQAMLKDLLQYSRVKTRGKDFEEVDTQKVYAAALANLEIRIEETNAEVTSDHLPMVYGDRMQLLQLFQNLIGNALKFHGNETPRVHVGCRRRKGVWEFSVRDFGIGIAPDNLEDVFTIFKRLHTNEEYEGTGVGLALCKKIVERHGGEIRVESTLGEGADFQFSINTKKGE